MEKYYVTVDKGVTRWFKDAKRAVLHRTNGPAVESGKSKQWLIDGKLHREDGPAVEWANGDKMWYANGKYHRVVGPAIEWANGDKHYYTNGQCHRIDGPAIDCVTAGKYWYINGVQISRREFDERNEKLATCAGQTVSVDGVNYKLTLV